MVITHEDDERVDVLVPKREDVLNACIFVHLSGPAVFSITLVHSLICVPKVSVLRGENFGTLAWSILAGATDCASSSGLCDTSCVVY